MKTQPELKIMYERILASDVWHGDKHMTDYCVKKAAYIVELTSGDIVVIEKPDIQKDFCFGYSDSRYDTKDYDRANKMAEHAQSEEYFISANLKGIDKTIAQLEGIENNCYDYYIRIPYSGQPENSRLKAIHQLDKYETAQEGRLEGENRQRVIDGYNAVRADFIKRLNSWLKRYGVNKIHTWSYWRDE